MPDLRKTMKTIGAITLACVAVSMFFGGGALGAALSAFLLLNAFLVLGSLVWA